MNLAAPLPYRLEPSPHVRESSRRAVQLWLMLCMALVACMVMLGGVTRLTNSGLSIVEWRPITGTLPPLSEAQWQEELQKYRQSPEYRQVNKGMSLEEFKGIFWLEYLHRLLGRMVGLAFFAPWLYFTVTQAMSRRFSLRMLGIFALGGMQGLMGWLMVKSGLNDDPMVSPFRLAAHLSLAFAIFCLLLLAFLSLNPRPVEPAVAPEASGKRLHPLRKAGFALLAVIIVQILLGAFVAGLDAGLTYQTWPLMDGQWVPDGLWLMEPWYLNPFENITMVQFNHRMMAIAVATAVIGFWWYGSRFALSPALHRLSHGLLGLTALQFGLGIASLLHLVPVRGVHLLPEYWFPVSVAALHQLVALFLLATLAALLYGLKRTPFSATQSGAKTATQPVTA
jgi:cytochrome c oxidase assembly protein subunit 15